VVPMPRRPSGCHWPCRAAGAGRHCRPSMLRQPAIGHQATDRAGIAAGCPAGASGHRPGWYRRWLLGKSSAFLLLPILARSITARSGRLFVVPMPRRPSGCHWPCRGRWCRSLLPTLDASPTGHRASGHRPGWHRR
jgi:hypothetical protein